MKNRFNIKKLLISTLFSVIALVIFVIEAQIPFPVSIYGLKPGLANIVILFVLFLGGKWKARDLFLIFLVRVLLAAFITGQTMSLIYSLTGGIAALLTMIAVKAGFKNAPAPFVSVTGAIAHNTGQLAAAAFVLQSTSVFAYFPVLIAGGIISGLLTGFVVWGLFRTYPKFISYINYI
ncbi:MAG: Gx transporter family protein [Oscillospiraceae bacterium]|nr:Gx transporter family protein [Oscillospiraceae bacterium]